MFLFRHVLPDSVKQPIQSLGQRNWGGPREQVGQVQLFRSRLLAAASRRRHSPRGVVLIRRERSERHALRRAAFPIRGRFRSSLARWGGSSRSELSARPKSRAG